MFVSVVKLVFARSKK